MANGSILISGAGIAGPTLAYWLGAAGFKPVLIESAPALRTGGYVIDFWGLGYDIAERMGLAPDLDRLGYHMQEMRIVNGGGRRVAGFGTRVFRELTGGRFVTIRRSDLSRLLFEKAKPAAEVIFGDGIAAIDETGDGPQVQFEHGEARRFDLVIGADGLHSQVRRLAFGPQSRFEKPLGYAVAAFEAAGYRPRDENVYLIYNEPGRMVGRFALREDRTLFLFVFADASALPHDLAGQKALLRERYGASKWECPRILAALDGADELYMDKVSQIGMNRWSQGRVALAGDAAFCPSLMAGQGAALAMTAAYVLAGELSNARGHYKEAFAKYEALLRPFMESKQNAAEHFSAAFAPKTPLGLFLRNQIIKATAIPGVARLAFGREITDALRLPQYSRMNLT
jgi:2-polyprenyl-6-methoxyphenol hydroxylase-like FAD-dependent oxidoreductase